MIEIRHQLKVSVVIPAFNEEEFIGNVIHVAQEVEEVDGVLVVDDGSTDKTTELAKKYGARVVSHKKNLGKGYAMKTGCERAEGDVLIFLDADLMNINPQKIKSIIDTFKEGYDFVKTKFNRRGGRVTRLTAKPLLGHCFPEISKAFDQPLSGQIGIKKELMERLDLEVDMGVDLGILIDVWEMGAKMKEVNFGDLVHDEKKLVDLEEMAKAVSRVVLDRASKYNRLEGAIEVIKENEVYK